PRRFRQGRSRSRRLAREPRGSRRRRRGGVGPAVCTPPAGAGRTYGGGRRHGEYAFQPARVRRSERRGGPLSANGLEPLGARMSPRIWASVGGTGTAADRSVRSSALAQAISRGSKPSGRRAVIAWGGTAAPSKSLARWSVR